MKKQRAAVLLAEGFEEVEALTVVDFLRRANIEVVMAGVDSLQVTGSHNITVKADALLSSIDVKAFQAVILPGGMPGSAHLGGSEAVISFVKGAADAGACIAAICAAPAYVLPHTGLLKDKTFTSFPDTKKLIEQLGSYSEERVVTDGKLITSRGPGTAAEFALAIIEMMTGSPDTAKDIFRKSLYSFAL
jgi:4-methyl-5(b-hydroxyethyl)-thiazole monophosphate biosynthesis